MLRFIVLTALFVLVAKLIYWLIELKDYTDK